MYFTFMSLYNSGTIYDIKFKFSAFLSFVEATKYVKFQCSGYAGFQADVFRISPIVQLCSYAHKSASTFSLAFHIKIESI